MGNGSIHSLRAATLGENSPFDSSKNHGYRMRPANESIELVQRMVQKVATFNFRKLSFDRKRKQTENYIYNHNWRQWRDENQQSSIELIHEIIIIIVWHFSVIPDSKNLEQKPTHNASFRRHSAISMRNFPPEKWRNAKSTSTSQTHSKHCLAHVEL